MAPGELIGGPGQLVVQRERVGAQRLDGQAGLCQAAGSHALRRGQRLERAVLVVVDREERTDGL